jgi:hypothetical protein
MSEISQKEIKDHYELYTRLQNDHRKNMLAYIYEQPRTYSELIDYTQLKPGSLYHHLNLLKPLVEKESHGLYTITDLGKSIAEEFELVEERKPQIKSTESSPPMDDDNNDDTSITGREFEEILYQIWNSWTTYVFIFIIMIVTVLLGIEGVSFAGSAVYATNTQVAFYFDLFAFVIGWLVLYTIEGFAFKYQVYHRFQYTLIIRLISMLPGAIIGLSVWLIYIGDIVPNFYAYAIIFALTLVSGTWFAATGVKYLRGITFSDSLQWAVTISGIDLLMGIIVLISY